MELIPGTIQHLVAAIENQMLLGQMVGALIPDNWPQKALADVLPLFLEKLAANPEHYGWLVWLLILTDSEPGGRILVGDAGFHGPPSNAGEIEIGYSILPQFRGNGYAFEAADGLIQYAFSHKNISRIISETSKDNLPSRRVLEKLGFCPIGNGRESGDVRFILERPLSNNNPRTDAGAF
jgi:RimJ/RimL family protein N-acetyltransferase